MYKSGFINLINNWGGALNFLNEPDILANSFCNYYDKEQKNIQNCWVWDERDTLCLPLELDIITYFRILVIGKPDYYKTKFVSTFTDTDTDTDTFRQKSTNFTENVWEITVNLNTVFLCIIEGPNFEKYTDQIANKLKEVDACVFVYDRYTMDWFESIERFINDNKKLLKNIQSVLWWNAQKENTVSEDSVTTFAKMNTFTLFEFSFEDKDKIKAVFTTVKNNIELLSSIEI